MENFDIQGQNKTGNSLLGELVLKWLRSDLKERGPRDAVDSGGQSGQGKSYESFEGKAGYGNEKRIEN